MNEIIVNIYSEKRRFSESSGLYEGTYNGSALSLIIQAESGEVIPGQNYALTGKWKTHPKWGNQFLVDTFVESTPVTQAATILYLQKYPGIGKSAAAKIWEHFGENALEKAANDPEFLATLPRIDRSSAKEIAGQILADLQVSRAKIEIMACLAGSGFPRNLTEKLYKKHGVKTKEILLRNPYILLQYEGCGFLTVDAFALKNGYNPLRLKRQAYFLLHAMEGFGDIWFEERTLQSLLVKQFGTAAKFAETLRLLNRAKRIRGTNISPDGKALNTWYIAALKDFQNEEFIAADIEQRMKSNFEVQIDTSSLTESQAEALKKAVSMKVGCFVGGPGTGKTYSVARYIKAIIKEYGADAILVAAPTGKAVVRSREMLASIAAECDCSTLHSFIYGKGGGPYKFIICDESSMIDAQLMRDFLETAVDASILFVGDDGQLLPVGKGRPFADFLTSGTVPVGKLTQTMRNSGRIVKVCHEIRQDSQWSTSDEIDLENGENLKLVRSADFLATTKQIIGKWKSLVHPIRDIQVIVGINKGPAGRIEMNAELQKFMNTAPPAGRKYCEGDPIICLKNNTYKNPEGEERVYLSNGEIGYCIQTEHGILADFGSEKVVKITENSSAFDLAYAVTCHKMQGSETPVAIIFLDSGYQAKMVCTREWLYTAISRAKKVCYLVGDKRTADDYCRKLGNIRKTFLAERLRAADGAKKETPEPPASH